MLYLGHFGFFYVAEMHFQEHSSCLIRLAQLIAQFFFNAISGGEVVLFSIA